MAKKELILTETLEEAFGQVGYTLPKNITPGKFCRFATGDKPSDDAGWLLVFPDGVGASFGCHRDGGEYTWQKSRKGIQLSKEEIARFRKSAEEARQKGESDREASYIRKAAEAQVVVQKCRVVQSNAEHAYLKRKQIEPNGALIDGESLVIPVYGKNGIQSLQRIYNDGSKENMFGGRMGGGWFKMPGDPNNVVICEGFGTGAAIHDSTGFTVVCAFSAKQLEPVAKQFKQKHPKARFFLAADDDINDRGFNTGKDEATKAARAIDATLVMPTYKGRANTRKTDFSDLMLEFGKSAVAESFDYAETEQSESTTSKDANNATRREQQRKESQEIGEGNDHPDIPEIMDVDDMIERLVFLADGSRVMDISNPFHVLALTDFKNSTRASRTEVETNEFDSSGNKKKRPRSNVDLWMESPTRKTAHSITFKAGGDTFVFDPEGRRCVNSWRGYRRPTEVGLGDASLFFDHINWLFGDRAGNFLDWLAHIEQKPGELPHTAWLHISSKTGTGRNWVSSVLARVFSGHVAPSLDLVRIMESGFNERLSRKTLAICDEIREGGGKQWNHAEKLKEIVTAEFRNINPKYGRMSVEYNACRFLLFSNHRSAIPIDDTDRRFEVVICDESPKPETYYSKLYGALNDSGFIAAVAKALAERDISGFKPGKHAQQSAEKRQVIMASQSDEVYDLIEFSQSYPHQLVTSERLKGVVSNESTLVSSRSFNHVAGEAGWVSIGRKVINGKKQTIYARREVSAQWTAALLGFEKCIPACDGGTAPDPSNR